MEARCEYPAMGIYVCGVSKAPQVWPNNMLKRRQFCRADHSRLVDPGIRPPSTTRVPPKYQLEELVGYGLWTDQHR